MQLRVLGRAYETRRDALDSEISALHMTIEQKHRTWLIIGDDPSDARNVLESGVAYDYRLLCSLNACKISILAEVFSQTEKA